jgi:bla regulator protein BlaR1
MTPRKPRNSTRTLLLLFVTLISLATSPARAQLSHKGPAAAIALSQTLAPYDVVSIKLHNPATDLPNEESFNMSIHDDIYTATNVPLEMILEFAYDIKTDQISGLSGPVSAAHFDIEAKVIVPGGGTPPKLTDSQLEAMIIPLLAERFHLKAHLQPKTLPVYNLVVQRGGPKIKLSQEERKDVSWNLNGKDNDKILTAKSASMADLSAALADEVHREVIDKTALTGSADITLKWSDEIGMEQGGPNAISIFTAIEEQLGLKLQPSKGPVQTLVIDHAEMPSAN